MQKEIRFKDLSWQLKVGIVGGWVCLISVIIGIIAGTIPA